MKTKKNKSKHGLMNVKVILSALLCAVLALSCHIEPIDIGDSGTVSVDNTPSDTLATAMVTKYFLGDEVEVRLEEDGTYSLGGGDIRLFEDQLSDSPDSYNPYPVPDEGLSNLAIGGGVSKWPNNTVIYVVSGLSASVRSELQKSFHEWSSKTNVRFKERTNEPNYVTISSSGSNSNSGMATLGMVGSRGFIKLGTRATALVIIHELGHTLGFIHEQNRSDRDDHIIVHFNNIRNYARGQFYKSNSAILLTDQLDVGSTMMYGSFTFSANGRPTITDLNGNLIPQRRASISQLDIEGTNSVYRSNDGDNNGGDGNDGDNNDGDGNDGDNSDDGDVDNLDDCSTAEPWRWGRRYSVGDRVTYRRRLFERDFTRWIYIKNCF